MMNSKEKKVDLSKYRLYTKDLDPNNPFHARILENFRVFKNSNKIKQAKKGLKGKNKD